MIFRSYSSGIPPSFLKNSCKKSSKDSFRNKSAIKCWNFSKNSTIFIYQISIPILPQIPFQIPLGVSSLNFLKIHVKFFFRNFSTISNENFLRFIQELWQRFTQEFLKNFWLWYLQEFSCEYSWKSSESSSRNSSVNFRKFPENYSDNRYRNTYGNSPQDYCNYCKFFSTKPPQIYLWFFFLHFSRKLIRGLLYNFIWKFKFFFIKNYLEDVFWNIPKHLFQKFLQQFNFFFKISTTNNSWTSFCLKSYSLASSVSWVMKICFFRKIVQNSFRNSARNVFWRILKNSFKNSREIPSGILEKN